MDARSLGLFTIDDSALDILHNQIMECWNKVEDDVDIFRTVMQRISEKKEFMAWAEFKHSDEIVVHRIIPAKNLSHSLDGTKEPMRSHIQPLINALKKIVDEINDFDSKNPSNPIPQKELTLKAKFRSIFEDLRSKLHHSSDWVPPSQIRADKLYNTNTSNAWVVSENENKELRDFNSQNFRDALGLIHLPECKRPNSILQKLVHLSFKTKLSPIPLPKNWAPDFIVRNPEEVWLVRPTICHQPNHRFVQRHKGDVTTVASQGRTIDISTDDYTEGFPELILLHGESASLDWQDMELLMPGPVARPIIDDNHLGFFQTIAERFGHTTSP